jgi:hypothetical protein
MLTRETDLGLYRYSTAISSQALLDPPLRAELIALGLSPGTSGQEPVRA